MGRQMGDFEGMSVGLEWKALNIKDTLNIKYYIVRTLCTYFIIQINLCLIFKFTVLYATCREGRRTSVNVAPPTFTTAI